MKSYKEILLVEDDRLFQFITQALIETQGIAQRVVCQNNGREALTFLTSCCELDEHRPLGHCVDLILLDLDMPVLDGFGFLQALQDLGAQALIESKVVVLSSSGDATDKARASGCGVKTYLEKPLTREKLLSVQP